jgi:sulfite exporter TauE/SafE
LFGKAHSSSDRANPRRKLEPRSRDGENMMEQTSLTLLAGAAAGIGLVHTLTGPDHTIPFVAMSRVGRWSLRKTMVVTLACGAGHVLSSVVLGMIGIGAGLAVGGLEWFEGVRGGLAGWLLLGFGLAYMTWGIHRAVRNRPHSHLHLHEDGLAHEHAHGHGREHAHVHANEPESGSMTPWILFTIFVFGPCEPLIPLVMYPAAKHSMWGVVLVVVVFGAVTLATMTAIVAAAWAGLGRLRFRGLERYGHAVAGFAITACGAAVQFGL